MGLNINFLNLICIGSIAFVTASSNVLSPAKKYTSIDQIIMAAGGGPEAFKGGRFRSADGRILAELDMVLSPVQFKHMYESDSKRGKRKAHIDIFKRWTDNTIPYVFNGKDFSSSEKTMIQSAMQDIETTSCLKFVPRTNQCNFVRFQNGDGCNSHCGMTGGEQSLNLGGGCRHKGTVLHEIGHTIGLIHEHQLPDRDQYLDILYENVDPAWRIWFKKALPSEVNQHGVPYDYRSIMHYGITAFSKDGKQTIRAKDITKGHLIQETWQKLRMSFSDIKVINLHYECAAHCPSNLKNRCPQPDSFLGKDCRCVYSNGRQTDPISGAEIQGTIAPTVVPCQDKYDKCEMMAQAGECSYNPGFMLDNCQVSCGICSLTSSRFPTQPTTTSMNIPCFDYQNSCEYWAKVGECETNPIYMRSNCQKSCNTCRTRGPAATTTSFPPNCFDKNASCEGWAARGECKINPAYMLPNCKRSCKQC